MRTRTQRTAMKAHKKAVKERRQAHAAYYAAADGMSALGMAVRNANFAESLAHENLYRSQFSDGGR